jgi:hypothetical protein
VVLGSQFARDRPKYTRANWLFLSINQYRSIRVKTDNRPIRALNILCSPNNNSLHHITLLHATARNGFLDGHNNYIPDTGVTPLRASQDLDAHHTTRSRIIGNIKVRLYLDHRLDPLSFSDWFPAPTPGTPDFD